CRARGARVIIFSDAEDALEEGSLGVKMPKMNAWITPIIYIIPLQLLAYYLAVLRGRDPDKPRNLAKSCTVE
ncbi:MAG: glutamine--fructose-6-phosphate aminotransferase, partial [Candidatus Micrarchaeota archaeon]